MNKLISDSVMRLWRKVRRYELKRTLSATQKRMEYVEQSLAYIAELKAEHPNKWLKTLTEQQHN